jgi:hypothetical protein
VRRTLGLALHEGLAIAAGFAAVASSPLPIVAPAMVVLGVGIHMLHDTLQTKPPSWRRRRAGLRAAAQKTRRDRLSASVEER